MVVSNIFYFHPYLGRWSQLTNIFQMGWNHQLERWSQSGFSLDQRFFFRCSWLLLIGSFGGFRSCTSSATRPRGPREVLMHSFFLAFILASATWKASSFFEETWPPVFQAKIRNYIYKKEQKWWVLKNSRKGWLFKTAYRSWMFQDESWRFCLVVNKYRQHGEGIHLGSHIAFHGDFGYPKHFKHFKSMQPLSHLFKTKCSKNLQPTQLS